MNRHPSTTHRSARRIPQAVTIALVLGLLAPLQVQGGQEKPTERLEEVERAWRESQSRSEALDEKAAKLQRDIRSLQQESIAAARKTQDLEAQLSASEESLLTMEAERDALGAELEARRGQLYHTLAALQRLSIQPSEAVLVGPGSPADRVRSALLLRTAVPAIEKRAASLRADLERLAELRRDVEEERARLAATARALADERHRLEDLLGRKKSLHAQTLTERSRAQARARRLAEEADDLRGLITALEREARERAEREARLRAEREARLRAERDARERAARLAEQQAEAARREDEQRAQAEPEADLPGTTQQALVTPPTAELAQPANIRPFPNEPAAEVLVMPVRGRMTLGYGQRAAGEDAASKGISIATRPQAQVVAPYDGQVVYAGQFRGYGEILIIEHGGRYHTLLAGLERINAVVGQWVLAGEPIGVMGSPQGQNPELYLELRRAGQPVNPLPWLAKTNHKVQG